MSGQARAVLKTVAHHNASVEHQIVCSLGDVGGVDQVVVGVLVLAVTHLQSFHKRHQRRHGYLHKQQENKRTIVQL